MSHRVRKCSNAAILFAVLGGISSVSKALDLSQITNWTGSGSNEAGLVIDWSAPEVLNNSSLTPPATEVVLVWGYRFNGTASGQQMLDAIVAADPRLFGTVAYGGSFVEGLGYDVNNTRIIGVTDGTTTFGSSYFVNGLLNADSNPAYNADTFGALDSSDVFWGGYYGPNWESWTAQVSDPSRGSNEFWTPSTDPNDPYGGSQGDWTYAEDGLGGVTLSNGSWLGFTVARGGFDYGTDDAGTEAYENDKQAPANDAVAAAPVPEPASITLLTLSTTAIMLRRKRR